MLDKLEAQLTPRRRRWAYGVTTAAVAILATYGLITGDQAAAWLYLVASVLGMATAKTDPTTTTGMPADNQQ
jgi:O-antigen ligase